MSGGTSEDQQIGEFSVKFSGIPKTESQGFARIFPGYRQQSFVRAEPGGCVLGSCYPQHAEKIYRFQPRADDVWVVTFSRCGTTWTQELVWLLSNNCDFDLANRQLLTARSPFLEMPYMLDFGHLPTQVDQTIMKVEDVDRLPAPRVIKTHLPFYLLPPQLLDKSKVVYVSRNPKDAIVSLFHHQKLMRVPDFQGDIDLFAQFFIDDEVIFSPFFGHVLDAWSKRHHHNMLFLFYEDMKKDLLGEVKKVAEFLQKSLTEEQLDQLVEHLRFDSLSKNDMVNGEEGKTIGFMKQEGHFIRKGKTGDWKNHFSPELDQKINQWIAKNLEGTDLKFVTELEKQD